MLDRTIFYPEGGGQACDLGEIGPMAGGASTSVASVTEAVSSSGERLVLHAMAGPCAALAGDAVRLSVDRPRRIDYSQQHTAEHLIGSAALRLLGANVVSVRFGSERSLIDFDLPAIPEEELAAVEEAVETAIAEDHPLRTRLCPPEDAASFPLRRPPPAVEEVLRVVEIEGLDFSPCCGLHLGSTGELRMVKADGTAFWVRLTATTQQPSDTSGQMKDGPTSWVVLADISEQKQTEQDKTRQGAPAGRAKASKNASKTRRRIGSVKSKGRRPR